MSKEVIPTEQIALRIRYFRGENGVLDFDLAALYDGQGFESISETKSRAIPKRLQVPAQ